MSINALWLDGWDGLSTWGYDDPEQSYYAQLTRNGGSDDDGPEIWISTVRGWPPIGSPDVLADAIARCTGQPLQAVRTAMKLK